MSLRSRSVAAGVGIVALGALVLGVATRDRTPPLTRAALDRARATWRLRGLIDYDITLQKEVDQRPSEVIRTEIRGGKAVRLVLNKAELPVSDSYSVAGLFETLEAELEMKEGNDPKPGQPANAILRTRFDDRLGVPVFIHRLATNRQSYAMRVLRVESPGGQVAWEKP